MIFAGGPVPGRSTRDLGIDQRGAGQRPSEERRTLPTIRTVHYCSAGENSSNTDMVPGTDSSRSGNASR